MNPNIQPSEDPKKVKPSKEEEENEFGVKFQEAGIDPSKVDKDEVNLDKNRVKKSGDQDQVKH